MALDDSLDRMSQEAYFRELPLPGLPISVARYPTIHRMPHTTIVPAPKPNFSSSFFSTPLILKAPISIIHQIVQPLDLSKIFFVPLIGLTHRLPSQLITLVRALTLQHDVIPLLPANLFALRQNHRHVVHVLIVEYAFPVSLG